MFTLEELQKMNKNELITIIGNYISDQEIWINKVAGLEKQLDDKNAEIERLKKRHGVALLRNDDLDLENYELKKQVDELTEEKQQLFQANVDTQEQLNTLRLEKKRENAELQKQVDELKERESSIIEYVETNVRNSCPKCKERTVKDTVKDLLIEFNEWINGQYDAKLDTYSVHIPVHEVNDFLTDKAKEYGVEVE